MVVAVGMDFSLILLLLIIIPDGTAANYKASIDELKPCFERYIGQRLADLTPYHSEWRMKTPENCLLFCALSSSRCRAIVHDMFQHICYYFLDDGQQHARIARGMVYFRVTGKECLDQFLSRASPALLDSGTGIPEAPSTTTESEPPKGFIEVQRPILAFANPLIHIPPDGRAITPIPYFDNPQKLKKFGGLDESKLIVTMPTATTVGTSTSVTTTATPTISTTLFSKVLLEGDGEHEIYDEVVEMTAEPERLSSTPATLRHDEPVTSASRRSESMKESNSDIAPADGLYFVGNAGKLPEHDENSGKDRDNADDKLSKLLKIMPDEIRRSPLKASLVAANKMNEGADVVESMDEHEQEKWSIVEKPIPIPTIKSISMTLSKHDDRMERLLSPACGSNERDVWLAVENAILHADKPQKKTSAETYQSCKAKCNLITNAGRDCPSFTYYEVERHCMLHTNNVDAVSALALLPSTKMDFNVRTATKFCYPESLTVFNQCSEFAAFRDYTLDVEPREIFDNMPKGREGLHACIELCVLAPNFHCKSATFDTKAGKCVLRDEDSLSSPEYFREHQQYGLVYFENGCEQFDDEEVPAEAQVERVTMEQSGDFRLEQQEQLVSGESYIEN